MRVSRAGRWAPERGLRPVGPGAILAAALLFGASTAPAGPAQAPSPASAEGPRSGQYAVSARVVLLGNLGEAGSMVVESALEKNAGRLKKTLRLAGSSTPEQAKKNRDYSGDFSLLKLFPLRPDGSADELALAEDRWVESTSAGFLKTNKKSQSEQMTFFPDHAIVVRPGKPETRVEGSYGCILSPLEYLMDHDITVGQVVDVPFVLNGVPRIFRLEVKEQETLSPLKARAYEIVLYAIDRSAGPDKAPKDVWRKKGNLRIWFCKEGPFRNQMLRMKIKFRWYLSLVFDLKTPAPPAPGT